MDTLWQDLRYGARMLAKRPGFTAVAVLTLALGIGANTAIFSIADAVLLRPLPYQTPDRLVTLWTADDGPYALSAAEYFDFKERQRSFDGFAVFEPYERGLNLTGAGEPVHAFTQHVPAQFFSLLGVEPMLGRTFTEEEIRSGNNRAVVLRHDFWKREFGGDPSVVGETIALNGENYVVLGVMPPGFTLPFVQNHIWVPLVLDPANPGLRTSRNLVFYGRLKSGVSHALAGEDVRRIAQELATEYPEAYPEQLSRDRAAGVRPIQEITNQSIRPALLILLGAVGLVLLIACANVANLLLSRAASREKEVAIRSALGAGRGRIIRQLLTESTLLSCAGGLAGILLANWGLDALVEFAPQRITRMGEIGLDFRVLAFGLGLSFLTGIIFGLVPSLHSSRVELHESLKEGGRGTGAVGRHRMRHLLVVAEVALSLILLVGAGLLIRTFYNLLEVDPGFRTENVQTFRIWPPAQDYPDTPQVTAFYQEMLGKIRALPAVEAAGGIIFLPLHIRGGYRQLMPEGLPQNFPEYAIPFGLLNTQVRTVTPGYFQALGIQLVRGRFFDEADTAQSPQVLVVDENFARKAWPGEQTILGKRVARPSLEGGEHSWWTVIGVVRHARDIRVRGREVLQAYFPAYQTGLRVMHVAVKTSIDPGPVLPAIRRAVASVDPNVPLYQVRTMDYYLSRATAHPRFYAFLMGVFSFLALALSVVGLYGVISYSVSQRRQEIGIRMALGAPAGSVLLLVLRQGLSLIGLGSAIGLAGAYALTRFLESLLFGVTATDPWVFAGVALVLAGVALLATYVPARRASRVDPVVALRYE